MRKRPPLSWRSLLKLIDCPGDSFLEGLFFALLRVQALVHLCQGCEGRPIAKRSHAIGCHPAQAWRRFFIPKQAQKGRDSLNIGKADQSVRGKKPYFFVF